MVIGVLAISSGIFFLMYENQEVKEDVFKRSLRLLGEQLLSMLPEGEERAAVAEKWQEFANVAEKGEVPLERVERVAIGILNASNLDTALSTREAEDILALAFVDPSELVGYYINHEIDIVQEPPEPNASTTQSAPHNVPESRQVTGINTKKIIQKQEAIQQKVMIQTRLQQLGQNLEAVCEFNKKVRSACDTDPKKRQSFVRNFRYEIKDGIRLNADMNFKEKLKTKEYRQWAKDLELLDKKNVVEWRHNFSLEIDREMKNIKLQLDSLNFVIESFGDNNKAILEYKGNLEKLKSLQHLQYLQAIDSEEIKHLVHESLEEAGVSVDAN